MRKNILAAGVTLLAVALLFGVSYPTGLLFSIPISILNIILGLVTRAPPGLEIQPESASIRFVIDRGVVRASIYQFVFLNSKLILKRLSSVRSEEHTSELQSLRHLVCRLLLEKKK